MKVYAIDLDDTADRHVEKVNALYESPSNLIVIHTARSEAIREETVKYLEAIGLKYHALVMGKLRADVYIDDKNAGGLQW